MALDKIPAPNGNKCRVAGCNACVSANHLYCDNCWFFLAPSYKNRLMDAFDPKYRLGFQPLEFARARLAADKYIEQTQALFRTKQAGGGK